MAIISGNYDDSGLVANIAPNGEIFEQDPVSGCIVNGQVTIIDPEFNVYDLTVIYSNCAGDFAILNGATFTGLAILDNTVTPEQIIVAMTGAVGGVTYSVVFDSPRI